MIYICCKVPAKQQRPAAKLVHINRQQFLFFRFVGPTKTLTGQLTDSGLWGTCVFVYSSVSACFRETKELALLFWPPQSLHHCCSLFFYRQGAATSHLACRCG